MLLILLLLLFPIMVQAQTVGENSLFVVIDLQHEIVADGTFNRCLKAVIGDSLAANFDPVLTITAWDDECHLKIDLPTDSGKQIDAISTGRRNQSDAIDFCQRNGTNHEIYRRDDGNLEWEIILNSAPNVHSFSFPISTSGLKFYYQDTLMDHESLSYRPDSVIGSYAVYHSTKRNGLKNSNGTMDNYGTGKAFHIYRPKAWDSDGDTVWCELLIDEKQSHLTITIPQDFLDRAKYPVIVDPTFGTTGVGATTYLLNGNNVRHCRYTMGATGGTVDSIAIYIDEDGGGVNVGGAIYDESSGCNNLIDSSTAQIAVGAYDEGWLMFTSAATATLSGATDYWISACADAATYMRYDDNNSDTSSGHWSDAWPFEASCNDGWNANDYTFSVYVVYTTSGGEAPSRRRRTVISGRNNQ